MNNLNQQIIHKLAKYSLSFLWIFTGLTSIYFSPEIGYDILSNANITGLVADVAIYFGGILDIILGLWFITSFKTKLCCMVQISVITTYTVLLTFIDASFWLHPFGPLTKNIPIIALIGYVYVSNINHIQSRSNQS
ncbi:MAG: NAD-dependent dehydratase [Gammaproteobacteria bacterium]|nr:NAD-dependent dehydratase [Gammaproteobacteria bacterium]